MSNDKDKMAYDHAPKTPAPLGNKHVPPPQNKSKNEGNSKK